MSEKCDCCGQALPVVYRRKLSKAMALGLLLAVKRYAATGERVFSWNRLLEDHAITSSDQTKLAHWALIEDVPGERADGNPRNGFWRITDAGIAFVSGQEEVRSHVILGRGNRLIDYDGDWTSFQDALGEPFDYGEMMAERDR